MNWLGQVLLLAMLAIGLVFITLVMFAIAAMLSEYVGIPQGDAIASLVAVVMFSLLAFVIGCQMRSRLSKPWFAVGWLLGPGALFWYALPCLRTNGRIDAYGIMLGIILQVLVPLTGAAATWEGICSPKRGIGRFLLGLTILVVADVTALSYFWTLSAPKWWS